MKRLFAQLTSNAGLILLTTLAIGVWTSNLQSFYQQPPSPSSTVQTQTVEERLRIYRQELRELGRAVKAKYPEYNDLSDEELGRKLIAKYPNIYRNLLADVPIDKP